MPTRATRAPAAWLATKGRSSSTRWSRPRSGGVTALSRSMTPATAMAPAAQRRTRRERRRTRPEIRCRRPRRPAGIGGHDQGMVVVDLAVAGRHAFEQGRARAISDG